LWTIHDASYVESGGNIYTFGDRFVTSRWDVNTDKSVIECRCLHTGLLLWRSPDFGPVSALQVIAFNEDAVYAYNYHSSSHLYYALNPDNGQVKWSVPGLAFGCLDSPIFDCERNPIINTSLQEEQATGNLLKSVDKHTGSTRWMLHATGWALPYDLKVAYGETLYIIIGAANESKRIMAVDLHTGMSLYSSAPIPGPSSQNTRPFIGHDGTIYMMRDGGELFAITDTGSGFAIKWQHSAKHVGLGTFGAVEADGNILYIDSGYVVRLNHMNGQVMAVSSVGNLYSRTSLLVTRDSLVILSDRENFYMALSYDLQTVLWTQDTFVRSVYALPNLSYNGTMIMTGEGTSIMAYRNDQPHPPVADFLASAYRIESGQPIQFTDFSSYQPTSWQWYFDGGTPTTSSLQNPTITYHQPGIYYITLIVTNALVSDTLIKNCYIEVMDPVGIHAAHTKANLEVRMYPNPTTDHLIIEGSNLQPGQRIRVSNLLGRQVHESVVEQIPFRMDLSKLSPAPYIITIDQHAGKAWKILKSE
jgi:outer membrane protein assembly factor BamB